MVLKIISATEARTGTNIMMDGVPCVVKRIDISKTGKHGASKCRIEAVGLITGQKKIIAVPGHERFEVPMIDKRKAQVLSLPAEDSSDVSIMDLESFETIDVHCPDEELKKSLEESGNVEYWDIEGEKIVKRKL